MSLGGWRSIIAVPLILEGEVIAVLDLARPTVGPFSPRQIELVETFAQHAVIAIKNAKLFEQVQHRTAEVEEALVRQTATAQVLEVISNSVEDTKPVFSKILDSCERLIPCSDLRIVTIEADGLAHLGEVRGVFGSQQGRDFKPMPVARTMIQPTIEARRTVSDQDGLIRIFVSCRSWPISPEP